MGRRKERRLAAMATAGGRRVRLDLFLDPSPVYEYIIVTNDMFKGSMKPKEKVKCMSDKTICSVGFGFSLPSIVIKASLRRHFSDKAVGGGKVS
ncbi:hypothetical protein GUJ93_ZPchr0006g46049 [Zizania palustris]|uniref:Uncharacterized protein n=1 Tax=Zizania palustris TaxID=103762 RepID=A0A8J5VX63_ZIZPA|nr:hypothetical protein GUJ93_ZPchr0006g46049 [Zizania palustris]